MLIKIKTLTRLRGDHKRRIDPGTPICTYLRTMKNSVPFDNLGTLHMSR